MPSIVEPSAALLEQAAGKTVIITGAANGIGAAAAALFNTHGATVVIADLEPCRAAAEAVIKTLPYPEKARYLPANILNWAQMKDLFKVVVAKTGGIDIVVANAAIMETSPVMDVAAVDELGEPLEPVEAYRVIDVNLKGTLNTLRLALHYMREKGGSVVMVASTSGYLGGTGVSAYVASKHGVVGLLRSTKGAAQKLGIRVNAIAPFFTPTHITGSYSEQWKASGMEANTPEGVAAVIVHTALDASKHGTCTLAAGNLRRELENTRQQLLPTWMGEDVVGLMETAGKFFESLGGYPLPKKQ
ncbi:dehydrogenase with different specificitie, partial [Thozetella sp. PMI_491]